MKEVVVNALSSKSSSSGTGVFSAGASAACVSGAAVSAGCSVAWASGHATSLGLAVGAEAWLCAHEDKPAAEDIMIAQTAAIFLIFFIFKLVMATPSCICIYTETRHCAPWLKTSYTE
jgi:hypothetical protein